MIVSIATDHSVRDFPQQAAITSDGMIRIKSKIGRMSAEEYSFPSKDWIDATNGKVQASLIGVHKISADTPVYSNRSRKILFRLKDVGPKRNPRGGYGLRQYIILPDGSTLYIARIKLELYAKRRTGILDYLDRLLKLPGVDVKTYGDSHMRLKYPDSEELSWMQYAIRIDADSQRCRLTDSQINDMLLHIDVQELERMDGKTVVWGTITAEGQNWRGTTWHTEITVTSRSMAHLTDYMYRTWPNVREYSPGERYYRDEKRRHVTIDFSARLYLDTPEPEEM